MNTILVLNRGSSTLKAAIFESSDQLIEVARIAFSLSPSNQIDQINDWVATAGHQPNVVGHRVVHGGQQFRDPVTVDDNALEALEHLSDFAPQHIPVATELIKASRSIWPEARQVACFDTAFHRTLPRVAFDLSLPRSLSEKGIRRYGFHGLNCEHVVSQLNTQQQRRCVVAHLGSGASVTAIRDGQSVQTSMCLSPNSGFPMATRTGDLDPGVITHLLNVGYSTSEVSNIVEHQSGLLGWSGLTADMKQLLESHDHNAQFAVHAYCQHVAEAVAKSAVALGGVDTLVFTGGIGERAEPIRSAIRESIGFLGPFETLVVPANEELTIAKHSSGLQEQQVSISGSRK